MSLKQQLTDDMKAAMKAGEKARLGVIRLINAAIKQREVDSRAALDEAAVIAVLEKMRKQRQDSISQYQAANREDLAAIERAEMEIIDGYLPAKLGGGRTAGRDSGRHCRNRCGQPGGHGQGDGPAQIPAGRAGGHGLNWPDGHPHSRCVH